MPTWRRPGGSRRSSRPIRRTSTRRWSRTWLQPLGGVLSGYRDFGGFRLPAHVEAGNHFGTDAYFPFFVVDVT